MRRLVEIEKSFIELNSAYSKLHSLNLEYISSLHSKRGFAYPKEEANTLISKCKELRRKIKVDIKQHQDEYQNLLSKTDADVELSEELALMEDNSNKLLITDVYNGYYISEAKRALNGIDSEKISLLEISKHNDPHKIKKFKQIKLAFLNLDYRGAKSPVEIINELRELDRVTKNLIPIYVMTNTKNISTVMQKTLNRLSVSTLYRDEYSRILNANIKLLKLKERK